MRCGIPSAALMALLVACDGSGGGPDAGGVDMGMAGSDMGAPVDIGAPTDMGPPVDMGPPPDMGPALDASGCVAGLAPIDGSSFVSINEYEAQGGAVQVSFAIQDDPDQIGTSGTTPYESRTFGIVYQGTYTCITDPMAITYTGSHHNFDDRLAIMVGGTVFTWIADIPDYGQTPSYSLQVTPMFGPAQLIPLTSTGCSTSPLTRRCFGSAPW